MTLRVVTLNLWNREGDWERRHALIRAELAALEPDIVAFQEVVGMKVPGYEDDQARQIVSPLEWSVAYGPSQTAGRGLFFGNALVSPHPIEAVEVSLLPGSDESSHSRTVLHAVVRAPGGDVLVFVTHLNWREDEGPIREKQVRFIAELIAARSRGATGSRAPLLMGDLNAEATSPEIAYLLGGEGPSGMTFVDCWLEAGDGGAGHTLTPDNPNAALRHSRARRIDYVLLARPATPNADQGKGRPVSSRLVFNQPADGVWPSDHFGVLADIAPY